MPPSARAAAAAIAAAMLGGRKVTQVFDHDADAWLRIDADTSTGAVDAYDYGRDAHMNGPFSTVFDYGEGAHMRFAIRAPGQISGYHHGSEGFFDAQARDGGVDLYDHAAARWFAYTIA